MRPALERPAIHVFSPSPRWPGRSGLVARAPMTPPFLLLVVGEWPATGFFFVLCEV